MDGHPDISVIIVTYNQAAVLERSIASLHQQDLDVPFEIVVCDDGSDDSTQAVVKAAGSCSRRLRYVWQPDFGFRAGRARNNGLALACGRIIVMIDGDCVPRPFFLRHHYDAHRGGATLFYGGRLPVRSTVTADGDDWLCAEPPADSSGDLSRLMGWLLSDRPWMACVTANLSVERSAALRFDDCFEGWGSEDRDFAYRAWRNGAGVALATEASVFHVEANNAPWHPFCGGGSAAVVSLLENKARLLCKYPDGVMLPSVDIVRHCYRDAATDEWKVASRPRDVTALAVIEEFQEWRSIRPRRDATMASRVTRS